MAAKRPLSPKERRDSRNARSFVGRIEQQDQFQRSLLQPDHPDSKVIFSISGQGGVGKTTLLKEFRRIVEKHEHVAAYVDEGVATNPVDDVPEAMHRLAEDLERQGFKFDKFREQYKAYRIKKQEMEADPEAPKGLVGDTARGLIKGALDIGKSSIPYVGGMIDSEMVATKTGELVNYGWERFRNKDEERLMKETLEVLTPLFLEGVQRISIEKTLVLMLDTYEITGTFLDGWVRALLNEEFGSIERSLLLCVAGQQSIDRNAWIEWEPVIARSPLEPFTKDETCQFLTALGIRSEAVINEIWRLSSGGLPLLVSMMAQNAPTRANAVVDYCELAVERFLKWETDDAKKQLAQDAAFPRVLNGDVVAALEDGQFEWLKSRAFVVRDGKQWRYHSVVRKQMLRYQLQKSPKRWAEVHGKLAAYYDEMRCGLKLDTRKEAKDSLWRELSLEWLYHELSTNPHTKLAIALNGFLTALTVSRLFAQEWATVMMQVGQEARSELLQQWGSRLRDGLVAHQQKRYEAAVIAITTLLGEPVIESEQKTIALAWRGRYYRWLKQTELSLKDFQQAVEVDGENSELWFNLALTYRGLERYEEAISAYQRAIELDPELAAPHNGLGNVYGDQKRYEEAISAYQRAIELDPEFAYPRNGLGTVYQEQKRYEEAISAYQRAIELNPKYTHPHINLGNVYRDQKRYEEAISAYQRAIELDPEFAYPRNALGNVYRDQKRYEEAISAYQRAIELDPEFKHFYNNLGNVYRDQKRYEEAISAYQRAIELDPESAYPRNALGNVYRDQKRYEEAILAYQQAIQLDPKYVYPYNNLGNVYRDQKRYEEAISAYQRAIELDPEFKQAFANRGQTYEDLGRFEEACIDLKRVLEIDPHGISSQADLGFVYYILEDYEASLSFFQTAFALQPDNSLFPSNLAYLYLLQGHIGKAQELIEEAIKSDPFERTWINLGLIQAQQGKIDEAKQSWQRGLDLLEDDSDWDKAVHYVFIVALGNPASGLEQMQRLVNSGTDKTVLRNALNDTIILSRSQPPLEGIEEMLQLLQQALS